MASGGEALGEDILGWCREAFGVEVNEFYGQTEANLLVGNCASLFPVRPGSMGRATPGHRVEVVAPDGRPLQAGESGIIAVQRPDPVMFLGYWNNPEATRAKFAGDWCLTGDVAVKDDDGYIWYKGREDDLISSGGYRIGPTDIEDCLMKHPAVLMAAVVGSPDPVRGEIVKAFVVVKPEIATGPGLSEEIRTFVGERLAYYQAPREIVFLPELPLTATGKIMRRELRAQPGAQRLVSAKVDMNGRLQGGLEVLMFWVVVAILYFILAAVAPAILGLFVNRARPDFRALSLFLRIVFAVIALICLAATSYVHVESDEIAVLNKIYGTTSLPGEHIIATNGEKGPQAEILTPGWHPWFLVNVIYQVENKKVVSIPSGKYGFLNAKDGPRFVLISF